jgi:hypothetical protein
MTSKYTLNIYEIRIKGCLEERWLRWFEDQVSVQCPEGETIIHGEMDQATLYGILTRIRDLGMELISVQQVEPQDENKNNLNLLSTDKKSD